MDGGKVEGWEEEMKGCIGDVDVMEMWIGAQTITWMKEQMDGDTEGRTDESFVTCMCKCHLIHLTKMTLCDGLERETVQKMHLLSCNQY